MSEKKSSNVNISKEKMIQAIALIVLGILFCAFRSSMLSILFTIIGVVLICVGAIVLFNKDYAKGIVGIVLGIVVITCGWTILDITLLVLGIITVLYGIYIFIDSFPKYKTMKGGTLVLNILAPIFVIVVGALLITSKWVLSDAIFIVLGVIAIIDGVLMLIKK